VFRAAQGDSAPQGDAGAEGAGPRREPSRVRVFRAGAAVAVASPALSGRDRLAVAGPAEDALPLVRDVLAQIGPTYRPFGPAGLVDALVHGLPGLVSAGDPFLWMETTVRPGPGTGVVWLDADAERAAAPLFDRHFPQSYAQPGRPGVRRWAGAYGARGRGPLLAVAADAWSAPACGFLAGVVTDPQARGCGLGAAVARFVVDALVRDHGRAALMVDADNAPAIRAYERAGLRAEPFRAAAVDRAAAPLGG
jgi:GNAT superfamily N-acetyltransferase